MKKLYAALAAAVLIVVGAVLLAMPAAAAPDVYYKNCAEAREAGAAPIHRGEPGYRDALDRDRDGVACEVPGRSGKRSDDDSKKSKGSDDESQRSDSSKSTERSDDNSSSSRTYSQIGDDDVPVGGVAAGGG